jgi:hypothetical protein
MFETICRLIPQDNDFSNRTRVLDILTRVLDGRIYDVLPFEFHEERTAAGEYIPLRSRRPNVRYSLARIVVEDSVSLLFSEGHFPRFDCPDKVIQQTLADIVKETRLNLVMTEAAVRGSVGSVAVLMRVLNGRVFLSSMPTTHLTASWSTSAPDTLQSIQEMYKVSAEILASNGYQVDDPTATYWFTRVWDAEFETWYVPTQVGKSKPHAVDPTRTIRHGLGFVPIVWIRNLPGGSSTGDGSDGACTFRAAIESQIEIDYQLSQAGRGLKYSSDPTLLIKDPSSSDDQIIKGAGNALVVSEKGDARLLEIGGSACAAVIDYVRTLREFALESVHGNRANPERLSGAQSGRAIELLSQGLLWLADNLRISYGEIALLDIARMIVRASQVFTLRVFGQVIPPMDTSMRLSLIWPRWYPPSAEDRQKEAQTLIALTQSGIISRETATRAIANSYDIENIAGELSQIADDCNTESEQ